MTKRLTIKQLSREYGIDIFRSEYGTYHVMGLNYSEMATTLDQLKKILDKIVETGLYRSVAVYDGGSCDLFYDTEYWAKNDPKTDRRTGYSRRGLVNTITRCSFEQFKKVHGVDYDNE